MLSKTFGCADIPGLTPANYTIEVNVGQGTKFHADGLPIVGRKQAPGRSSLLNVSAIYAATEAVVNLAPADLRKGVPYSLPIALCMWENLNNENN